MTPSTGSAGSIDYAARWRAIVESRREYMDRLYAALDRTTANYWQGRAGFFRPSVRRQMGPDQFLDRVLGRIQPGMTVLDVGAGGGRYAIPIAAAAKAVTAVEPAEPMVEVMREEATLAGVNNLTIVHGDWLAAEVGPADIVICSHVIYPIADVVPFLTKLREMTRGVCMLYLNVDQPPWEYTELWTQFHDEPMRPQPTYIDAYNLLHQLGVYADVEIVTFQRQSFMAAPTFEAAADRLRDTLILDTTPATTERLHDVLRRVLVQTETGWQMPPRPARAAIISWS